MMKALNEIAAGVDVDRAPSDAGKLMVEGLIAAARQCVGSKQPTIQQTIHLPHFISQARNPRRGSGLPHTEAHENKHRLGTKIGLKFCPRCRACLALASSCRGGLVGPLFSIIKSRVRWTSESQKLPQIVCRSHGGHPKEGPPRPFTFACKFISCRN